MGVVAHENGAPTCYASSVASKRKAGSSSKLGVVEDALAAAALAYPETKEEAPWGHRAFKVKGKTFLFLGSEGNELGLSVKLPHSNAIALALPFTEPTHYGLGKSGWVSASFKAGDEAPVELLLEWLDESFRAIAPKKLVSVLSATLAPPTRPAKSVPRAAAKKAAPAKRTATKRTPAKKPRTRR
jgi:predicted DNA-binding protein (MmcQ/YjbR family)